MKFTARKDGKHVYSTADGDMVDLIAFKFYGHHEGTMELVLDANKGLAEKGLILSAGQEVILPPEPDRKVHRITPLWD